MKKGSKILVAVLGIASVILIGTGTTLAFLTFSQEGTTENTMTAGTMEFHYDETNKMGRGITLLNAVPASSNQDAIVSNDYFDFSITGKTSTQTVTYVVTAKLSDDSDTILGDIVDLALTRKEKIGTNDVEYIEVFNKYNEFVQYGKKPATEKVIYTATVPANSANYEKNFRLRMWIDQNADFSGREVTKYFCSGTEVEYNSTEYTACDSENLTQTTDIEYDYNDKTFTLTINVYTDTNISDYAPITNTYHDAKLTSLSVTGCTLDKAFDADTRIYTCNSDMTPVSVLPITYTTANPNATVLMNDYSSINRTIAYPVMGDIMQTPDANGVTQGNQPISIIAEDGITVEKYDIIYTTYMAPRLNSLSINGCSISFNKYVTTYSCSPATALTTSDFTYAAEYSNYTTAITQTDTNKFEISVTTPDGGKTNTYTVNVE